MEKALKEFQPRKTFFEKQQTLLSAQFLGTALERPICEYLAGVMAKKNPFIAAPENAVRTPQRAARTTEQKRGREDQ